MLIDPTIRVALLESALLCGGLFAAYRVMLTVFYPLVSGAFWQHILGPMVEARFAGYAQCEDSGRPSYMPLKEGQPYVMAWGLLPPPLDDVTHGIRDGLLLGVLVALLPEVMTSGLLTLLLGFVLVKAVWRISRKQGAARTDYAFWALKELLIYGGAIAALGAVGFLH